MGKPITTKKKAAPLARAAKADAIPAPATNGTNSTPEPLVGVSPEAASLKTKRATKATPAVPAKPAPVTKAPKAKVAPAVVPAAPVVPAVVAPVAKAKTTKAVPAKKPATKKAPAKAKISAAPAEPSPAPTPGPFFTADDIALRAYFIAEKRQAHGWPGTPDGDWVEAERQLREEFAG